MAVAEQAIPLRELVYQTLCQSPMTADEVAGRLGMSILSIRPRLSELVRQGRIEPTGKRRSNASGHSAAEWKPVPVQAEFALCAETCSSER